MPSPSERHQPLPPVARLPGYAWRRMGPAARAAAVALFVVAVAAAVILAPRISESKRATRAQEARDQRRAEAARLRDIQAMQRPHRVSIPAGRRPAVTLKAAVLRYSRSRDGRRALRVDCRRLGPDGGGAMSWSCEAVTRDIVSGQGSATGTIGFPYRALTRRRTLTFCRVSGVPGEGSFAGQKVVLVPRACGG